MRKAQSAFSDSFNAVQRNIAVVMAANGIDGIELAKRIGVTKATYYNHRKRPELWTLEQLVKVASALNTSLEWLVSKHEIGG